MFKKLIRLGRYLKWKILWCDFITFEHYLHICNALYKRG